MAGYLGNVPVPQATMSFDNFTATAGQTSFATSGYTPNFLQVYLNGVHLVNGTDYTATNGSDVVLTSGAADGDTLEVVAYSTFEASDVTASSGFTVTGNLSVDGGTIKLDGNYPVGTNNVALGDAALDSNVSGASNTAIGADALTANTTASYNTAVGYQALNSSTGAANTAVGFAAMDAVTTGTNNTAIGVNALGAVTTGAFNCGLGDGAGDQITTGSKNVVIGRYNGNQGGLDIRTSSNNIVLSDGDGNPRLRIDSSGFLMTPGTTISNSGFAVEATSGGTFSYRATTNGGFGVAHYYSDVGGTRAFKAYIDANGSFQTTSDYRVKENVADITDATNRIKSLRPVSYNQVGSDQPQEGFIAHELQEVIPHVVTGEKDQVKSDGSPFIQSVNYSGLIATLTAALKESITRIEQLEEEVATLKGS